MAFHRTDDGPLAILTLEHGDLNLFDRTVLDSLAEAARALSADPPRGLLIQSEGRVVSAGVDVNVFKALSPTDARTLWIELLETVRLIEDLPCPTVFAAHSLCLTAAFELGLACDLLVASAGARFGLVETVIGLTPSMGGTQRLAERAGPARAKELIYTGELFDAATLERWNVVNRVWPDDGFAERAYEFAMGMANGPTRAHAATKRLVAAAVRDGAHAADALLPEVSSALFATDDLPEAVATFLREGPGKARFSGR
jgi:enoyl-CoA hydratase/carnithine racemase